MRALVLPLLVAAGSGLGGLLRFWCSGMVARLVGETFPFGTLAVNVLGSFLIGFVAVVTGPEGRVLMASHWRLFWMLGVFGGFTTFSSFSLQTLALIQDGEWWRAAANVVGSALLCLVAVWLGWSAGALLNR